MRLRLYTDYALRVLTYLGAHPGRLCSVSEIAQSYDVSRNHLTKVVHDLGKAGFVDGVRGRSGGIRLARSPEAISVGQVVRHMEGGSTLVDCSRCPITPCCRLSGMFAEAMAAFIDVLDRYRLADLIERPDELTILLGMQERSRATRRVLL